MTYVEILLAWFARLLAFAARARRSIQPAVRPRLVCAGVRITMEMM